MQYINVIARHLTGIVLQPAVHNQRSCGFRVVALHFASEGEQWESIFWGSLVGPEGEVEMKHGSCRSLKEISPNYKSGGIPVLYLYLFLERA